MKSKSGKDRLLGIYKNEVKKNLKRKYNIPNWKAEIGIKKYGLENDFIEHTEDYEFVEPERVAIEVFEDILEDKYMFKTNDKYVLGVVKREPSRYGIQKITLDKVGRRLLVKRKGLVQVKFSEDKTKESHNLHPTSVHEPHHYYALKDTE